jgi:hypothetical protein
MARAGHSGFESWLWIGMIGIDCVKYVVLVDFLALCTCSLWMD